MVEMIQNALNGYGSYQKTLDTIKSKIEQHSTAGATIGLSTRPRNSANMNKNRQEPMGVLVRAGQGQSGGKGNTVDIRA